MEKLIIGKKFKDCSKKEKSKLYGKIKESRLLNIEVYEGERLIYKGKVEEAPEEIKEKNYQSVKIKDGWVIYNI